MEFTQNTYVSIIDAIRNEVEERAEALSYASSKEMFLEQLRAICAEYSCQFFGFNLVRLLHKKCGDAVWENDTMVSIGGMQFAKVNVEKPSMISEEDKEKYARILARMICETGKFPMSKELAIARCRMLLRENRYLEDDMEKTHDIEKTDILNIARGLALSFQDTNELLFRTLESGALTDTSAADLIERFIIENNQSVSEREQMLAEYTMRTVNVRKPPIEKRKDNITQTVFDQFYDTVLSANKETSYEERRKLCLEYLVKNARFLDAHNRTAMLLYEKLLCYVRNAMNGEYEKTGDEQHLFKRLNRYLIVDGTHKALKVKERVALTQILLTYKEYDSMEEAYGSWSVPSVNGKGELIRIELGSRMEKILRGDRKVLIQKKDILFALFLACSLEWGYDNQTDIAELQQRIDQFENLANALLETAFLNDQFYLPHPLETSIAIAIMCGPYAEGVFGDITAELSYWDKKTKTNSTAAKKKLPKAAPDDKKQKNLLKNEERIWKNIDSCVRNAMKKLTEINADETVTEQVKAMAAEIYAVWEKEEFCGIDVYFDKDGTWGYLPITSIGLSYESIGKTPEWIHSILYGDTTLDIPFASRIKTGKKEKTTLQNIIDTLLPELDKTSTRMLHRKALVYLLLRQIQVHVNSSNYEELTCEAHVNSHRIMKITGLLVCQ